MKDDFKNDYEMKHTEHLTSLPLQECLLGVCHAELGTTPVKQPLQVYWTGDGHTRPA